MKTSEEKRLAKNEWNKKWRNADPEKTKARDRAKYAANRDKRLEQQKKYYLENKEKVRAYNKKYHTENKEMWRKNGTAWRKANPEKVMAAIKRWGSVNKDKLAAASKKWYEANREKCNAISRAYKKDHPEKNRVQSHLRRARQHNATIGDPKTIAKWEKSWRSKKFSVCYWCSTRVLTKTCHMDHIRPLAKGGSHSIENLCISCQPCNNKKCASDLQTWNSRIEQPVMF